MLQYGVAQNLIPNPGFDELFPNRNSMYPWVKINTVDYFLESTKISNKKTNKVDKNFILRKARSSPAYIGLRIQTNYREFIQIKIDKPLVAGHHYRFEMYMVPSDHCDYYVKSLGVSFYNNKNAYASDNIVKKFQPQVLFFNKKGLKNENGSFWKLYTADFIAKGNEQYITIGEFSKRQSQRLVSKKFRIVNFKTKEAYIYLDDISLIDLDAKVEEAIVEKNEDLPEVNYVAEALTENKKIVLHNIIFDYNSAKLKSESYAELQLLLDYMNNNLQVEIEIIGHTDNIGDAIYNQRLSNLRAKAVYDYLVSNKINKNRLSYTGKGFDEPIADNNTAEGRNQNRRVEIKIK